MLHDPRPPHLQRKAAENKSLNSSEHAAGWTEERVELLKKLWGEGKSASEVVAHLGGGLTRNGVIGKAHRLKLPARKTPQVAKPPKPPRAKKDLNAELALVSRIANGNVRSPKQKADDSRVRTTMLRRDNRPKEDAIRHRAIMRAEIQPLPSEEEPGVDVTRLLGLMQLNDQVCRWPIGDPLHPDFGFCGDPTKEGSRYCPKHHRRAYIRL